MDLAMHGKFFTRNSLLTPSWIFMLNRVGCMFYDSSFYILHQVFFICLFFLSQPCPAGAACFGDRIWSEVKAKFGYFRLHKNDSCRNDTGTDDDLEYSLCMNGPDDFYPCTYPAACLGDKNPEFFRQFIDDVTGQDMANQTTAELCNIEYGFNQTCYDQLGRPDSCRLCRACKPEHWAQGFEKCVKCGEPAEIVFLTLGCVGMVVFMLVLFLHTALAETEELSKQAESSHGHLAQSLQKIILNHLQLLALAGNFPLRWPREVQTMFEVAQYAGSSGEFMFNPQCVFKAESKDGTTMPDFFAKQLFIVVLPIFCLICCTLFWFLAYVISSYKKMCKKRRARQRENKKKRARKKEQKKIEREKKKRKQQQQKIEDSESSDSNDDESIMGFGNQNIDTTPTARKQKKIRDQNNITIPSPQMVAPTQPAAELDRSTNSNLLSRSKLREIFNKADTKKRGHLDKRQFSKILARRGQDLGRLWSPEEISTIFNEMMDPVSKLMSFGAFVGAFVRHTHNERALANKLVETRKKTELGSRKPDRNVTTHHGEHSENDGMEEINHMDKWVATIIALCYLLYPTLCNATFALVGCRYIGKYYAYIQMDMQIKCYDDYHWTIIGTIFTPALLAYVIGIPVLFLVLLKKNITKMATNKHVKFRYSTLLIGYRPETYYWEVVISARKAAIVAISVFLLQFGPRVQTLVAQSLTALLLIVHTHFEPFVAVTKNRNPLHHGDFFALVTAFLTLTAGIYLFQNVGESAGFQTFLTIVVIFANVLYVGVTMYWYMALRLVDMENELIDSEKNQAFTSWLVMMLQKILPDWRARASLEEIVETNNMERTMVHNVDVQKVLHVKNIAQKWRMKSKRRAFEREAKELEDSYEGDQLKLVQKLERLRRQSALQIQERISKRKEMRRRKTTVGSIGGASDKSNDATILEGGATVVATKKAVHDAKMLLPSLSLTQTMKLSALGFQLKADHKGRAAVRAIDTKSTAFANGIRDGFVLRYVGEYSTKDETLQAVVRLLKTQPRPCELRFEHLDGGVSAGKEENAEEDDPEMI